MGRLTRLGGEIFWTMIWVFIVLIIGFAILSFLSNKFSGNVIGGAANWTETHAQPQ